MSDEDHRRWLADGGQPRLIVPPALLPHLEASVFAESQAYADQLAIERLLKSAIKP